MKPPLLQELKPAWAHLCLDIEKFVTSSLGVDLTGKSILAGVSGGADSVALLFALKILSARSNIRLYAAHVDHCLRDESSQDAEFVRNLCRAWQVESFFLTKDVATLAEEQAQGLEQAGREVRYSFFEAIIKQKNIDFLALGHTRDDLAEDILMRLVRGTGWPALGGMFGYDPARKLIRPLLETPKEKLKALLDENGVSWREDDSNQDLYYTRNRFRKIIIPSMLQENPAMSQACTNLWRLAELDRDYWDALADGKVVRQDGTVFISHDILKDAHKALRLRLYKLAVDETGPGQALLDNLFNLDQAWMNKRSGARIQFPGGKTAEISKSGIKFTR